MPCRPIPGIPGAIACSRRVHHTCCQPGCTTNATKQCDFPVNRAKGKSTTCDAWMCARHATKVGDDLDWCPPHKRYADERGGNP